MKRSVFKRVGALLTAWAMSVMLAPHALAAVSEATASAEEVNLATQNLPIPENIVVGPGDPIRVPLPDSVSHRGQYLPAFMCSIGAGGVVTDGDGRSHTVALTAGHCLNTSDRYPGIPVVGEDVYVPTPAGDAHIGRAGAHAFEIPEDGTFWHAFNGRDYGVIELDPGVVPTSESFSADEYGRSHGESVALTGIQDARTLAPGEVSFDNLGQPICKDGARTGRACGVQVLRARNGVWSLGMEMDKGDSGGSAYNPATRELIGVNSMVFGPISRVQPADVIIEEVYAIPDGQVNEHFVMPEPDIERNVIHRTIAEDAAVAQEYLKQTEVTPPELSDVASVG